MVWKLFHKRKLTYPAAFLLSFAVLLAISAVLRIFPFGEKSLVVWDANVQYIDFLAYFRRMLLGRASWDYTFSKTLGGDMAGFIGYYLNSPFGLCVLFFENWEMARAFQLIYFLKIACCAVSCQYYFNNRNGRADWTALIFSTTYALTAYNFVYGYNIMWLDAVILLPLLAASIEKIVQRGKGYGMYAVSLMAGLYTCYYMGYILCMFAALYFLILWLVCCRKDWGKIFRFAAASAMSAGLTAFSLLPVYYSLSRGSDRFSLEAFWMGANFQWADLLTQTAAGGFHPDQIPTPGTPPLFQGVLILWLVSAFFLDEAVCVREKLINGLMLAVLLLSMWSRSLNIVWQGFVEPNGCNYRYAFLCSFICISAAKQSWDAHLSGGHRPAVAGLALAVSLFLVWRSPVGSYAANYIRRDILFLLAASAIFSVRKSAFWMRAAAAAVFLVLQTADLGQNGWRAWALLIQDAQFDLAGYEQRTLEMDPVAKKVAAWCEDGYRMELNHYTRRSYNDSMQYGYAGLSHYSSAEEDIVKRFEETIGLSPWLEAETPDEFTDSLLGVRYRISLSGDPKKYPLLETDGRLNIYENSGALPVIFAVTDMDRQVWENIMERRKWGKDWPAYEKPLSFRKEQDGRIRCEIKLREPGRVLTTIPFDPGWSVWVDGERTDVSIWLDTFTAFDIEAGNHEIVLEYRVKGRMAGTVISLFTAGLGIFLWRRKSRMAGSGRDGGGAAETGSGRLLMSGKS